MYKHIKRIFDFLFSLFFIVFLGPIMLIICLLVKFTSKGPIIFKQKRVGMNKKYFNIYKFRTMRMDTPKDMATHLLENPEIWITPIGKFLRKTSLDELPQLLNILFGNMSFVGPRPALYNQYDLIAARDKYNANSVMVGLTGLAQVSGRDEISIEEKARIDGIYIREFSFLMDFKCIIKTFIYLFHFNG